MKKILLSILTITAFAFGTNAQNVNIPDANFKTYLVGNSAINTNSDTEIQVSEAAAFAGQINCSSLSISDLTGIEYFTALTGLQCQQNSLTALDVTNNTALTILYCFNNSITALDVTNNTVLTSLACNYNSLTALDVANGNNINFTWFNATINPNLSCITVDDATYSTTNWTNIDAASSFSLNCSAPPCSVNIPDANFKAYLVGNTAINTNLDTEIQCSEAAAFAGTINCGTSTITDLTGIEEFVNLTVLLCSNNPLASVDLSQNIALTEISFLNNNLSAINLSTNTQLTYVEVSGNSLSSLDISMLTNLTQLWAKNNGLYTLSLPSSSSITTLVLFQNNLTSLDLSLQSNLVALDIHTNNLSSLNVANSNNTNFSYFKTTTNPNLTCIEVDNVAYSTTSWTNIDATASFSLNCSSTVGVNEQADNHS
ncbi:MAG: hypothetical protein JKY30_05685, partial [Flavobacteriales bacterium]|nr:hypothetical protein [Flavobacteriales bacterium]